MHAVRTWKNTPYGAIFRHNARPPIKKIPPMRQKNTPYWRWFSIFLGLLAQFLVQLLVSPSIYGLASSILCSLFVIGFYLFSSFFTHLVGNGCFLFERSLTSNYIFITYLPLFLVFLFVVACIFMVWCVFYTQPVWFVCYLLLSFYLLKIEMFSQRRNC